MTDADLCRKSPNVLYLGDVVKIDLKDYGYFIGKITIMFVNGWFEIANGMGGSAWGNRHNLVA
jgi:hypothetical protein